MPLIGNLLPFARDPYHFLLGSQRAYGDVVRFTFGPVSAYLLAHPDSVRHVLLDNSQDYDKRIGYVQMKPLLGDGLLVSEGDISHQRSSAQPPFQPQHLGALTVANDGRRDCDVETLGKVGGGRRAGQAQFAELAHLTHAIMGRMLFGIDFSAAGHSLGRALSIAQQLSDDFTLRLTHSPLAISGRPGFASRAAAPPCARATERARRSNLRPDYAAPPRGYGAQ